MGEIHLPPGVFGPVLIPHMVLVQQPAGFNVQVFGEGICRHACIHRFRKLGRAACSFSAFGGNKLGNRIQYRVGRLLIRLVLRPFKAPYLRVGIFFQI